MGRNNTGRKIKPAVGKDEVPGPNPGSSSRIVPETTFHGGFRNFFVIILQRFEVKSGNLGTFWVQPGNKPQFPLCSFHSQQLIFALPGAASGLPDSRGAA